MKKTVLFLLLTTSMIAAQAATTNLGEVKAELDSQKSIIRDNKFYPATNVFYTNMGVFVPTFKEQLDSQKKELRDYNFYPATNVSYLNANDSAHTKSQKQSVFYTKEGLFVPSFKEQLAKQVNLQLEYKFYPVTAVSVDEVAKNANFKTQLDSQKTLLKDYKFYPATNVYYTPEGVILPSFKDQLDGQKVAVRDYKFYPATNVVYTDKGVYVPTVKAQLDSQKNQIRSYKFYPAMSVSYINK